MRVVWTLLGLACLSLALMGLLPLFHQVIAYQRGAIDLPTGEPATYAVASSNGLVYCSIPTEIVLRRNTSRSGGYFLCTNNFAAPVTLTWSVVDGGGFVSASGSETLLGNGLSGCRTATLTAGPTNGINTVLFRGITDSAAPFYAEIHFTGTVTVQNGAGGVGGGC